MAGEQEGPKAAGNVADTSLENDFFEDAAQAPAPAEAPPAPPPPAAAAAPPVPDNGAAPGTQVPATPAAPPAEASGPLDNASPQEIAEADRREATARGNDPAAARLWHAAGLVYEEALHEPRQAAVCYQTAFKLDPRFRPNIHAARRLFTRVGNWSMVAQLLGAEAGATEDSAERAALMFERAVLLHDRLDKHADADGVLAEIQKIWPDSPRVLKYLEELAARAGDHTRLADLYARLAERTSEPTLKLGLLCVAGGLFADRLDDADRAAALYEAAHQLDPRHPVPLEALQRLYSASGANEQLVGILEATAAATPSAPRAAALLQHAAHVARERLGSAETTARLLEAARERAGDDVAILHELASVYEASQAYDRLADVLRALAAATRDPRTLAEVWHQLGDLLDEHLQRSDEATDAFRHMLEASPGSPDALAALGKLYFRAKRWDDLIWTFRQEIEHTTDAKQRAMRLFKIAEIEETRLERPDAAMKTLREVLDIRPGYLPALGNLTRLYETANAWADLVELNESELAAATGDLEQQTYLLDKIARIREERLSDPAGAAEAYERVLAIAPEHLPAVRQLERLYEARSDWPRLIQMIEREAELVNDQRRVIALLHQVCDILEDRVGDRDAAIEAWQKVLALQPNYLPALKALGKLYFQKGRWQELVEMYRMEMEVTESTEHVVALLLKMGGLYETQLLDEDRAIATYREVLEHRPDTLPALRALVRLHARRGDWDRMVDVLRREVEVIEDPAERVRILCSAAEVRETRSSRPDQAVDLYREALELRPDHAPALGALARLYGAAGAWRELAAVYERALATRTPADRTEAYRQLAHLYTDRLDEPARAVQCLEAVLGEAPDDPVILTQLERLYTTIGLHAKAAEKREQLAAMATTPQTAVAFLETAAFTHEHLEDPPAPAPDDWRRILELEPGDDAAARRVEIEARGASDHAALRALYEAQLSRADGDDRRLALSMRIAEEAQATGDLDAAEKAYRDALAVDETFLPGIRGLKSLLAKKGSWDEVQGLMEREGETSRDPAHAVSLLYEAGVLREEHLRDAAAAEANYRKVLERSPTEPRAFQRLVALLAAAGRDTEVAELHVARAGQLKEPGPRAAEWRAAADVFEQRLADPTRALAAMEQALLATPSDPDLLDRAADLAYGGQDVQKAAALYKRRLEAGGDAASLQTARLRLGIIYQTSLGDPQRAAAFFQDVLATDGSHREALRRLSDILRTAGNWAGTVTTLTRLAEVEPANEDKVAILLDLAAIHAEKRSDAGSAMQSLEAVRRLDPKNVAAVEQLGRLYEASQQYGKVIETYTAFIGMLGDTDKARAYPLWVRIAELELQVNENAARAISAYRTASSLKPDETAPRIALTALYEKHPDTYPHAVEEHREILAREPLRIDSYHALYRLFEAQKAFDKAFCVAAALHFLGACDQDEAFFYSENKGHAPQETSAILDDSDQILLKHPDARGPLGDAVAILGDQLAKVYPPDLDRFNVARSDKLSPKDGSPLRRLCDSLLATLGGGEFDLYRSERGSGLLAVAAGAPPAVMVSADLVRKHPVKAQRFLLTRLMQQVRTGTALALGLDEAGLAATLEACLSNVLPNPPGIARPDPDLAKRCGKSMSRKAKKALEGPGQALAAGPPDIAGFLHGVRRTLDRAGLLLSGDIESALRLVAAENGHRQMENPVAELAGVEAVTSLLFFLVGEDLFRLRQRLKMAIG